MERIVRIVDRGKVPSDKSFWLQRTPQERLEALEFLRAQYMEQTGYSPGMVKVVRIISREELHQEKLAKQNVGSRSDVENMPVPE